MRKNLLITGGAGFIGSHFVELVVNQTGNDWHVINLDKLTYASDKSQIQHLEGNPNYTFIQGDICDVDAMRTLFEEYQVHSVIHFAAESHVDNSISGPRVFLETNILGTQTLLESARHIWLDASYKVKVGFETSRFHHVSTDEVYGSLSFTDTPFVETTPYAPNSPYSASKASSDFMVRAYGETYGLPITMTNCSNNYGTHQHDEKFIPTMIRCALGEQPLPIYGDGKNVRDWLFVSDHCTAIWEVFTRGKLGETYNVGGNAEHNNLEIVKMICGELDKVMPRPNGKSYEALISFVKDRPGHDRRYAINATKIRQDLGWEPAYTFEQGIKETIAWYRAKYSGQV